MEGHLHHKVDVAAICCLLPPNEAHIEGCLASVEVRGINLNQILSAEVLVLDSNVCAQNGAVTLRLSHLLVTTSWIITRRRHHRVRLSLPNLLHACPNLIQINVAAASALATSVPT